MVLSFSWLSKILVYKPVLVFLGISVLSIICTIIPFLLRPIPDFSDPQKGFETRGTRFSNMLMAWRNLVEASKPSGPLTGNPRDYLDQRRYEEEFKLRKKKTMKVKRKPKQKPLKEFANNLTRGDSNSFEQDDGITRGIMRNTTSDSKNRTESVRLLFEELQNSVDSPKMFKGPNADTYFCSKPSDGYVQLLVASTKMDLFTAAGLYEVCRITSELENITPYQDMCEARPYRREHLFSPYREFYNQYDSHSAGKCCRPWTLPNYVALLRNRPSCLGLTEDDVLTTKRQLVQCAPYFFDKRLGPNCGDYRFRRCKVPSQCATHNAVYIILTYFISTDFAPSNITKTGIPEIYEHYILHETMLFVPIPIGANTLDLYNNLEAQMNQLQERDISIVAMNFGEERKHDVFNEYLVRDSRLMILGGVCVLILMWIYTNSAFLTIMTIVAILFSLALAYFTYACFYSLSFFPFMNLLTFIVAIGVGSDDSFIFSKIWTTVKSENANASIESIMTKTLDTALTAMAVTSATTAAAFMVSTLSAITAIRCFGIFAGTSVIVNFIIMTLWIPSCFVIYDRYLGWVSKGNAPSTTSTAASQDENGISLVGISTPGPVDLEERIHRPIIRRSLSPCFPMNNQHSSRSITYTAAADDLKLPGYCDFLRSLIQKIRNKCGMCRQRILIGPMETVRGWILYIVTGPPLSSRPPTATNVRHNCIAIPIFVFLTIVAVLAAVVVFHHPRLRLPESEQFQLFSNSHPFEQYDMVYKKMFLFKQEIMASAESYKMPLRFVWGVLPIDDGNHLDPDSHGALHLDPEFNISTMESQQFLLEFCRMLKRQPFYQIQSGPTLPNCFISSFKAWMDGRRCLDSFTNTSREPCCEQKFPYDIDIFNACVVEAMGDMYATPQIFLSSTDMAGPKFNKDRFPQISAVVVEYESNVTFSLSYTEVSAFVTQVEDFFKSQMDIAPHTMKRGWFVSELAFYDLQHSLSEGTVMSIYVSMTVALIILLGSTLNILTSLYAIFTITCSILVTLAILVLAGWRLNILESVAVSSAIGFAVDFSLHYTVKYNQYSSKAIVECRRAATRRALGQMIGPTSMAALTTSTAGLFMLPSDILAYIRIGVFLVTVMSVSWMYATFQLGIMLAVAGPERGFGQFRYRDICKTVRRKQRRRRRNRPSQTHTSLMQMAATEIDDENNGNLAEDDGTDRNDSHELATLTLSTDLGMVNAGDVIATVDEMLKQATEKEDLTEGVGPSGIQKMHEYEPIAGPSGVQQRRGSGSVSTQAQVHAPLTRIMSNGSSRCSPIRYIQNYSSSTESAITIVTQDPDEN